MNMPSPSPARAKTFLSRLARDPSGNVMAMLAAALFPLLALIGGGVDMGRGYLAQSRLQQACDAGVLAARQRLGASVAVDNVVPENVAETGNRFFNLNFRSGEYGTENRAFNMVLETNYAISGVASVDVPTTLMRIFGHDMMTVSVECEALLNFSNLDVMMVLDTTGSMRAVNAGDSLSRLDSLKGVLRNFHAQIEAGKSPTTAIRYGFVPYTSNVNVGHLLQDDWVVSDWTYQGREDTGVRVPNEEVARTFTRNWVDVSGTESGWVVTNTYAATSPFAAAAGSGFSGDTSAFLTCDQATPAGTVVTTTDNNGMQYTETQVSPAAVLLIQPKTQTKNGTSYRTVLNGETCEVQSNTYNNFVRNYEEVQEVPSFDRTQWRYGPISRNVSNWRTETEGCIEERDTYQIDDYDNVDFDRALDLDIDLVPTAGVPATQWRPRYTEEVYARRIETNGTGEFWKPAFRTTDEYINSGTQWYSSCPPRAQKLQEMDSVQLDTFLATLSPYGSTYHDTGMIWGGRLISPTGLFADENADTGDVPRNRHLIWMTDGQTEPYDLGYTAYGLEPLDGRRWDESSPETLRQTVENRFAVACEQVKNRNVTVWVIAFGTGLTDLMTECAGPGHYFQAANAEELNDAFETIASSLSELRITQ